MILSRNGHSKLRVGVLAGGIGEERGISLESGKSIFSALQEAGFCVELFDICPESMGALDGDGIDVFFLALHGRFGEDGDLQQILEDKGKVYTGSGPAASRAAFDKIESKRLFSEAGILVPEGVEFLANRKKREFEDSLFESEGGYVVKPIRQGSSFGVEIVRDKDDVFGAANRCLNEFGNCMIEEFIKGREIAAGILCGQSLDLIEIRTRDSFYDFHAKYEDDKTEYLFDTIADQGIVDRIRDTSVRCFDVLGCRHFGRADFILSDDGQFYALEMNTIPGFTSHSLLPKAAAKSGVGMGQLCARIIETALEKN